MFIYAKHFHELANFHKLLRRNVEEAPERPLRYADVAREKRRRCADATVTQRPRLDAEAPKPQIDSLMSQAHGAERLPSRRPAEDETRLNLGPYFLAS
jgi:hypothetical protein